MISELDALEDKIERLAHLAERLHAENEALRIQVAAADAEREHLRQTMATARERLEVLMDKLPEDA